MASLSTGCRFLGFDVGKNSISVFDTLSGQSHVIDNNAKAIRAFIAGCGPGCRAICEPTGGHEQLLLAILVAACIPVHRADTLKVKAFIRSLGHKAKTDRLDARGLAIYGQERFDRLPLWQTQDKALVRLQSLVRRRQDLIDLKVAETNRSKAPGAKDMRASFAAMLKAIKAQIEAMDRQIEALVDATPALRQRIACLRALKGVGPVTAVQLVAHMPELGSLTAKQVASLAGLAPHANESGLWKGQRHVRGGRRSVRVALFMAALTAARRPGPLHDFYKRLTGKGKKPIVAITALMRKMIVILNARLREHANCEQS